MPTYEAGTSRAADRITVDLRDCFAVRRVVVRNREASFLDTEGREGVLVQMPSHPGGGLMVDFADDIKSAGTEQP